MEYAEIRTIPFTKMSGAGNDFVVIDNRDRLISEPEHFAVVICDRRRGIGGDGLLLVEGSTKADFQMKYYNADGSYGGMCGNGGRCISRFAYVKQVVNSTELDFEALGCVYHASIVGPDVRLMMQQLSDFRLRRTIRAAGLDLSIHYVDTGSPHCVLFLVENKVIGAKLESVDVIGLGREIRYHEFFSPKGTNVNFVQIIGSSTISMRTYERGVEAETLACGTGSVASALIANQVKGIESPVHVLTSGGENLKVDFKKNGPQTYEGISLFGSAHIMFDGTVAYNSTTHALSDLS